jgi:AcrR family transcriptional regulator
MDGAPSTRTRILHAAMELIGREGPDRFTASALAREVGVSKATLFHHFDTLDEIPLAAIEEVSFAFLGDVASENPTLANLLEHFAVEMRTLVEHERFLRAYFVFFIKAMFDPRFKERLSRGAFEVHRRTVAVVEPHLGADDDAEITTRLVEVLLDGLALHHLARGDHQTLDRVWTRFTELLLAARSTEESP